jgi:general secretion pathway protein D
MRISPGRAVWVAVALVAAPVAEAQGPGQPPSNGSGRAFVRVTVVTGGVRTTVLVPDGGSALVGGSSRVSEARREVGVLGLSKVPYAGRGFRNVGSGRSVVSGQVRASVRVISLRDEEYRQTGFRSP